MNVRGGKPEEGGKMKGKGDGRVIMIVVPHMYI
jgi:hypothetical protein